MKKITKDLAKITIGVSSWITIIIIFNKIVEFLRP